MAHDLSMLEEFVAGRIWLVEYPIHYAGCDFSARTTLVRLSNGDLLVHSPGSTSRAVLDAVNTLGTVRHLVAPGSYHYLHVAAWQREFPAATTWVCPGVERKSPELEFDWFLSDHAPEAWSAELAQCLVRGNRFIWEVVFFDRASRTLIVTDLVENIGEGSERTNWVLRLWWKAVLHMWDNPKPAPEYQMGWSHKAAAKRSLERILSWDFDRVVLAHGENLTHDAKDTLRAAWAKPLAFDS